MMPSSAEMPKPQQPLFPLQPALVVDALRNLEHSSNQMLDMITFARGPMGAANELYANLPTNELIMWHISNNDFTEGGNLLYRVGLLYSLDLTSHIASDTDMTSDIRLTDPTAFNSALAYLKETYRGLDDNPVRPEWQRQKERELVYTGSDVLTLASAARHGAVLNRLKQLRAASYEDELAQYVGLVDGAVFVDAYRAFSAGRFPLHFVRPAIEYVPVFNPQIHVKNTAISSELSSKFESLDEVLQVTERHNQKRLKDAEIKMQDGAIIHGTQLLVQIGPNDFEEAIEIKGVDVKHLSKKRLGTYALAGAAVDAFYGAVVQELPFRFLPLATVVMLGLGFAEQHSQQKQLASQYESRGFHIISS